jgi:very-short-patch-repair endonuclease
VGARVAGYRVDALFEAEKVIIELDGYEFHKDKTAFATDRERDAATLALGYVTLRVTWDRLEQKPAKEAKRLGKLLADRAQT